VTKDELIDLCKDWRKVVRRLENHLSKPGSSYIVAQAMKQVSNDFWQTRSLTN